MSRCHRTELRGRTWPWNSINGTGLVLDGISRRGKETRPISFLAKWNGWENVRQVFRLHRCFHSAEHSQASSSHLPRGSCSTDTVSNGYFDHSWPCVNAWTYPSSTGKNDSGTSRVLLHLKTRVYRVFQSAVLCWPNLIMSRIWAKMRSSIYSAPWSVIQDVWHPSVVSI
jgi:hypothetical protein